MQGPATTRRELSIYLCIVLSPASSSLVGRDLVTQRALKSRRQGPQQPEPASPPKVQPDGSLPVAAILSAGIAIGFAGDQLLRVPAGPGLNIFLLFVGLAAAVWIVTRRGESPLSREASSWIGVGLLCSAALLWRGSDILHFGILVAAFTAFSLPLLDAGRAWTMRSGVLDIFEAVAGAGLYSASGSTRLMSRGHWDQVGAGTPRRTAHAVVRIAFGGVLLALVPLVVFGALFISADEVFATIVGDLTSIDLEAFGSHLVVITVLSWLACGYLVSVSSGTRLTGIRRLKLTRPTLGIAEVATAMSLVDLLFLGFVIVQFRYLFGGGSWVEVTPGITYAAYARAGFFQLVAAVALAIPWLLATHTLLGERSLRARAVFGGLAGVHLLLLMVVVASAIQRMQAYQTAYGLTELRVVVTAVLVWLTVVVVWFGATVFSGRRDRFAFGGLVTAFVLVGALQIVNPAGLVARHNLDRIAPLGVVDVEHLGSLGSDAAPVLVARLDELPDEAQCSLARRLLHQWGPERPADWLSFNWSESRARHAVDDNLETLRNLADATDCS